MLRSRNSHARFRYVQSLLPVVALDIDPVLFTPGFYLLPTLPAHPFALTPFRQLRRMLDCPHIHLISALHPSLRFFWILRESLRLLEFPLLLSHFSFMLAVRRIVVRSIGTCRFAEHFCKCFLWSILTLFYCLRFFKQPLISL